MFVISVLKASSPKDGTGPGNYLVQSFDKTFNDTVESMGVRIDYETTVTAIEF